MTNVWHAMGADFKHVYTQVHLIKPHAWLLTRTACTKLSRLTVGYQKGRISTDHIHTHSDMHRECPADSQKCYCIRQPYN
jgi:hypothetical protein